MTSSKTFSFVLLAGVLGAGLARAELVTDSPPVLTGSIVGATAKTVTLKLEDGRTTRKFPRDAFPKDTDFFPGRIVTLKVADEIRSVNAKDAAAKPPSDAEILRMIRVLHRANGVVVAGKKRGKSGAFDFALPGFGFPGVATADAADPLKCKPTSPTGSLLRFVKSRSENKCLYDPAPACSDPAALADAKAKTPGAKAYSACAPFIFGVGLCAPADGETVTDEARCGPQYVKSCEGLDDDACIRKYVLPYAKKHAVELKDYFRRTSYLCTKSQNPKFVEIVDFSDEDVCNDLKVLTGLTTAQLDRAAKDYETAKSEERHVKSCILADDPQNLNLDDKDNTGRFTTLTGSMCGGQKLCVRDVKCLKTVGSVETVSRYVRCRAENCNSARACLDDTLVGGSSRARAVKDAADSRTAN